MGVIRVKARDGDERMFMYTATLYTLRASLQSLNNYNKEEKVISGRRAV